jgi:hypothetical protein
MSEFTKAGNPAKSGVYMVDRGALGTPCRFYNAETDAWSLCVYGVDEALAVKDIPTAIGFLPWKGPVKAQPKAAPSPVVALVGGPSAKALAIVAKAEAKTKAPKAPKVKAPKGTYADGTVFFREDRNKWMVAMDGKTPCARPTKEAAVAWLTKKYPSVAPTFV